MIAESDTTSDVLLDTMSDAMRKLNTSKWASYEQIRPTTSPSGFRSALRHHTTAQN